LSKFLRGFVIRSKTTPVLSLERDLNAVHVSQEKEKEGSNGPKTQKVENVLHYVSIFYIKDL
jgi:hypothetical protein